MINRTLPLASLLLLLCVQLGQAQQSHFTIAKIEVEGLTRTPPEEVIAATGLSVGQRFDLATLDAAAQRLIDSGQFTNVAYSTRAVRDQMTITFRIVEAKVATSRVVFDNFVWFTDTDLIAAIRRDVPGFNGTAPDVGDMVERIRKSLERFLRENKIEGSVTHMASQDSPGSSVQEHVFTVSDVSLPVCSLHFPGSTSVAESKLIASSGPLIGTDYSNKFASLFAEKNLLPLFRELGHLKAAFAPPAAKPESSAKCQTGVDLTIAVDEGRVYKWNRADWSGIQSFKAADLDAVLDMKSGQVANGVKLDKSAEQIHKAYGRKGHLLVRVRAVPDFDDASSSVIYKFDVVEGPQFRMGQLTPKGFPEREAKMFIERWELKPGDVFDEGYFQEFSKKHVGMILRGLFEERRAQNKPAPNLRWDRQINRESLTVDLSVALSN